MAVDYIHIREPFETVAGSSKSWLTALKKRRVSCNRYRMRCVFYGFSPARRTGARTSLPTLSGSDSLATDPAKSHKSAGNQSRVSDRRLPERSARAKADRARKTGTLAPQA